MNERIKELAQQAGYYLYDLTETHEIKTVETDEKDEWITLEKFAELIVRECMKQSLEEMVSDEEINSYRDIEEKEYLKGNNQGVIDVVCRIKTHFGIEQ